MRITSLHIENFRAVRKLELSGLPDAIVIAGSNGCGKSSVFDAIKLLKSAYGQYHPNELEQWFNEAQINIQRLAQEASRVLYDPSGSMAIRAEVELGTGELTYLKHNRAALVEQLSWTQAAPVRPPGIQGPAVVGPTARRAQGATVAEVSRKMIEDVDAEIRRGKFVAELTMTPEGHVNIADSAVLELALSVFAPEHLGIVDYHGPHRNYGREQLGGINLSIEDPSQKYSQHALYNTQGKYANVKSEMARSYIRQLLAKEAGIPNPDGNDLIETLHELFEVFFPGKEFRGVIPTGDGSISFPVKLESGREHDINELSSGEREVLLGYLRLRNSAPKHSIILLDEPELHLNPRLIRGLPRFYQKHLGAALSNQLWLITHSDTLLREAVDEPTYSVFHMEAPHVVRPGVNQLHSVAGTAEVERVLMDLVGDLATYSPRSKVVIVEGGGDSEFDVALVQRLFPDFTERVNLVSGGSKRRVAEIHELLEAASREGKLGAKFFSIVDRDFDAPLRPIERRFSWDVYHVENYLLEPTYIRDVIAALEMGAYSFSERDIDNKLKACAAETIDTLVRIRMESFVNSALVRCISTRFDPNMQLVAGFRAAAERSKVAVEKALEGALQSERLIDFEKQMRQAFGSSLDSDRWKSELRGRDILHKLVDVLGLGIGYERFRNLIAGRMAEAGYQPKGMKTVIDSIMAEDVT
jgi:hypothetical protein